MAYPQNLHPPETVTVRIGNRVFADKIKRRSNRIRMGLRSMTSFLTRKGRFGHTRTVRRLPREDGRRGYSHAQEHGAAATVTSGSWPLNGEGVSSFYFRPCGLWLFVTVVLTH